jgi:tripartite-type tricarboxylate transporter receptor subunit TctC
VTTRVDAQEQENLGALEIVVPWGPGEGADRLARQTARQLQRPSTSPPKVTNVPGRTGNLAMAKFLAAPADGHSLEVMTSETYCLLAYLNPGWKASDVVPLAIMMSQPSAFFLPTSSRFKTWKEFEAEARQKPRTLRVAIAGVGSPDYMTLQQLNLKGIDLVPVPFAEPEERYRALQNGQADAVYE